MHAAAAVQWSRRPRQTLQRVQARGLQQPVAWDWVAFRNDKGLIDQRPEVFQNIPVVDRFVRRQALRRFEREAAGKHAETTEYQLLGRCQESMAPFEGGAQGLMAAHHSACASSEHVEPFVQALPQPVHAQ